MGRLNNSEMSLRLFMNNFIRLRVFGISILDTGNKYMLIEICLAPYKYEVCM